MSNNRTKWWAGTLAALLVVALVLVGAVALTRSGSEEAACPPMTDHPDWSVARRWDEMLLEAIRRDLPAPTVHGRNLYHTS
ncbi:MAG: hypothetical protein MUQ27_07345, partial [Acidimicrobiia bacterium]|nr:hypothetical protein [Acidimicrobiia bacterium]